MATHIRLENHAAYVFRREPGDLFFCTKSRDGIVVVGGKYSEDFVRIFSQAKFDVIITN